MNNSILDRLNKIAKQQNLKINLTEQDKSKTLRDLGLDSLSTIGMIVSLENEMGVRISNEALAKIKTLGELILAFENVQKK